MPRLSLPLTINEGIYSSIAQKLAHGGLLYQDAWDHKPPFIFWAYQLAGFFTHNVEHQAHGLALLAHIATGILIVAIARRMKASTTIGWLAGLFYGILAMPVLFQTWSGQADLLMQPFLLLAVYLALSPKRIAWFFAGSLWVSAFFFKQTALFYIPVFLYLSRGNALTLLTDFFWGVNALSAVVVAPFALSGRLTLFWQAIMGTNGSYVEGGWKSLLESPEFQKRAFGLFSDAFVVYGLTALAILGLHFGVRRKGGTGRPADRAQWMPAIFFLCALVACCASGAFYSYYFVATLPGLALMVPVCLQSIATRRWQVVAFLAMLTLPELAAAYRYAINPGNELDKAGYSLARMEGARNVGEYLQQNSDPSDSLVVWGSEPQIYSYSQLPFEGIRTPLVAHLNLIPEEEQRFESSIQSNPPTWIVVGHGLTTPDLPDYLKALLLQHYGKIADIGTKQIYKKTR